MHWPASLRETALFIDRIAELIPAKYLNDSNDQVDIRYLKKAERASKKEEFRQTFKESKRLKLDPAEAPVDPAPVDPAPVGDLRSRLQHKLEEMRKQRKADEANEKVRSAKAWKDGAMVVGRKKAAAQQRQAQRQKSSKVGLLDSAAFKSSGLADADSGGKRPTGDRGKEKKQGTRKEGLSFGKIEFGDQGSRHGKKRAKPSKQELLVQVEKDQQQVLTKAEEKSKAWKAALARAHGEKVLDDAKLLRKSIKKEGKMAEKKQKAWAERVEKVNEQQKRKQEKRRANLQSRVEAKREKKIARREKKLVGGNRAGFEGRKSTPIRL